MSEKRERNELFVPFLQTLYRYVYAGSISDITKISFSRYSREFKADKFE